VPLPLNHVTHTFHSSSLLRSPSTMVIVLHHSMMCDQPLQQIIQEVSPLGQHLMMQPMLGICVLTQRYLTAASQFFELLNSPCHQDPCSSCENMRPRKRKKRGQRDLPTGAQISLVPWKKARGISPHSLDALFAFSTTRTAAYKVLERQRRAQHIQCRVCDRYLKEQGICLPQS